MPNLAVVGAQWGDEGKGKIVDLLSERFEVVARFQGGPNAGHTVTFGDTCHALHHIPSGVFRPDVKIVVGNGTVIDLVRFQEEMEGVLDAGVVLDGRLFISDRAHVILPLMKALDALAEEAKGRARIGTTLRGIGPTYEAKASRYGLRVGELFDRAHLTARIEELVAGAPGERLRAGGQSVPEVQAIVDEVYGVGQVIEQYVADTAWLLNQWIDEGRSILFEGAQGTLLDIDHGSYPFVTSSNTIAGSLCAGLGVAPTLVDGVLGVFKAYCTRVGGGPMPTELTDGPEGLGQQLRDRGREYGTTTGRPRRCGWFDGVSAAYAQRINRFDGVCLMLLDVLDTFDEIRICTHYRLDGEAIHSLPAAAEVAERVEPVYESLPGWKSDTTGARRWSDLPPQARSYLDRLAEIIGGEIAMVGVGPDRVQSVVRPGSWLDRTMGLDAA